jgi:hypothetical protein
VSSPSLRRTASLLVLLAAGVLLSAGLRAAGAERPTDYEVKAAFLYNFARFVRWPEEAANRPAFVVAVVGEDPFGPVLDRAFAGKTVLGKPVRIHRTRSAPEAASAHIAFVGASERAHLGEVLAALESGRVLTVGDMERFADGGGMVGFQVKDATVRFEVNLGEVQRAGLQMSSQVIRLAVRVLPGGAG